MHTGPSAPHKRRFAPVAAMSPIRTLLVALIALASYAASAEDQPVRSQSAAQPAPAADQAAPAAAKSATAAEKATPQRSAAAAPANSAASSGDAAESSYPGLTEAEFKRLTTGFRKSARGDEQYWCRIEKPMGSNLAKRTCYTLEQLVEQERVRARDRQYIERKQIERPLKTN